MSLVPKPCPAGRCDAQLYAVAEFVFCPKCGAKNPDYRLRTEVSRAAETKVTETKRQPLIDLEKGVIKW